MLAERTPPDDCVFARGLIAVRRADGAIAAEGSCSERSRGEATGSPAAPPAFEGPPLGVEPLAPARVSSPCWTDAGSLSAGPVMSGPLPNDGRLEDDSGVASGRAR